MSAGSAAAMRTGHADALSRPPRFYGLGLSLGLDSTRYGGWRPVMHGGGGYGGGANLTVIREKNLAVAMLFNHPAGYGLDLMEIIIEQIGRGDAPRSLAEAHFVPGRYTSLIGVDSLPGSFEVAHVGGEKTLTIAGESHMLRATRDGVFATEDDAVTVGFDPDGRYAMLDPYGIGLVSALPFRRRS